MSETLRMAQSTIRRLEEENAKLREGVEFWKGLTMSRTYKAFTWEVGGLRVMWVPGHGWSCVQANGAALPETFDTNIEAIEYARKIPKGEP